MNGERSNKNAKTKTRTPEPSLVQPGYVNNKVPTRKHQQHHTYLQDWLEHNANHFPTMQKYQNHDESQTEESSADEDEDLSSESSSNIPTSAPMVRVVQSNKSSKGSKRNRPKHSTGVPYYPGFSSPHAIPYVPYPVAYFQPTFPNEYVSPSIPAANSRTQLRNPNHWSALHANKSSNDHRRRSSLRHNRQQNQLKSCLVLTEYDSRFVSLPSDSSERADSSSLLRRSHSDPLLTAIFVSTSDENNENKPPPQQISLSSEDEKVCCTKNQFKKETQLVNELLEEIKQLKRTNRKLNSELHRVRLDNESLRSHLDYHNKEPGSITVMVKEIRQAEKIREEAFTITNTLNLKTKLKNNNNINIGLPASQEECTGKDSASSDSLGSLLGLLESCDSPNQLFRQRELLLQRMTRLEEERQQYQAVCQARKHRELAADELLMKLQQAVDDQGNVDSLGIATKSLHGASSGSHSADSTATARRLAHLEEEVAALRICFQHNPSTSPDIRVGKTEAGADVQISTCNNSMKGDHRRRDASLAKLETDVERLEQFLSTFRHKLVSLTSNGVKGIEPHKGQKVTEYESPRSIQQDSVKDSSEDHSPMSSIGENETDYTTTSVFIVDEKTFDNRYDNNKTTVVIKGPVTDL